MHDQDWIEFPHHKTGERKWNKKELMVAHSILFKAQLYPQFKELKLKKQQKYCLGSDVPAQINKWNKKNKQTKNSAGLEA